MLRLRGTALAGVAARRCVCRLGPTKAGIDGPAGRRREGDGPALQRCPPALPGGGARLGWGEATYTAQPTLAATPAPVWSRVAAHCSAARFTRHGQAVYTIVAQAAAAGVKGLEPTSNALLAARTRTRKQPLLNGVRPTKSCAVSNKHALPQPHSRSCSLHWYCVYLEF